MRDKLITLAYALRREGIKILKIKEGRFPTMLILNPSERIVQKSVEIRVRNQGRHETKYAAIEQGVSLYW